jgi:hypothetical protein
VKRLDFLMTSYNTGQVSAGFSRKEKNHETCIEPSTDKQKGQICAVGKACHDLHLAGDAGNACHLLCVRRPRQTGPPDALPGAALIGWLLSPLPKPLVSFTSIAEMLGGLGLILPTSLRILPILTPLAAIGLIIVMVGATIFIPFYYDFALAAIPIVTGLLLAFVGYGCWWRQRHGFIENIAHRDVSIPDASR